MTHPLLQLAPEVAEAIEASRPVVALGFAYAAQEMALVPDAEFDMRLDGIVSEDGYLDCTGLAAS